MSTISAISLLKHLISFAVKSTQICRLIRLENSLFNLLIEQKQSTEFISIDFKTFADVLIQETVRYDLNLWIPGFGNHLFGEESNEFTSKMNKKITVKFNENITDTISLILGVLDGHEQLAIRLAELIHKPALNFLNVKDIDNSVQEKLANETVATESVQFWIDPIDSTHQYVIGRGLDNASDLVGMGDSLANVTVLLGAFDSITGQPLAGVISQPFCRYDTVSGYWCHELFWALCGGRYRLHSANVASQPRSKEPPFTVLSSSHDDNVVRLLPSSVWRIQTAAGAGYKLLQVICATADLYWLTQGSTYKWDVCGPHAVLRSIGGGVAIYSEVVARLRGLECETDNEGLRAVLRASQLSYRGDAVRNSGGLLAYSDEAVAIQLLRHIQFDQDTNEK